MNTMKLLSAKNTTKLSQDADGNWNLFWYREDGWSCKERVSSEQDGYARAQGMGFRFVLLRTLNADNDTFQLVILN